MVSNLNEKLDVMFPDARCELDYNKDYELLIATLLSAQCTDKRVNAVSRVLFKKYDIFSLALASKSDIEKILYSLGSSSKKSDYIIRIAKSLVDNYNGVVPNDRVYLESLPGVGRKTANVFLSNVYNVPAIAVDTHVERVSKRLKLVYKKDNVSVIEKKLMRKIPKHLWSKSHHQLVLFGRYICTAKKPKCSSCLFNDQCSSKDKNME